MLVGARKPHLALPPSSSQSESSRFRKYLPSPGHREALPGAFMPDLIGAPTPPRDLRPRVTPEVTHRTCDCKALNPQVHVSSKQVCSQCPLCGWEGRGGLEMGPGGSAAGARPPGMPRAMRGTFLQGWSCAHQGQAELPQKSYAAVLTSGPSECDLLRKEGLCTCDDVR